MENKKLIINNNILKNTTIIIIVVYFFLLTAHLFDYKDNLSEIDILKLILYLLIPAVSIYSFINRKIIIIITDNELQIKWRHRAKIHKYKLNNIKLVKFSSRRIEITLSNGRKVFSLNYIENKDKLKLKKFLINNFDSKYKLA